MESEFTEFLLEEVETVCSTWFFLIAEQGRVQAGHKMQQNVVLTFPTSSSPSKYTFAFKGFPIVNKNQDRLQAVRYAQQSA